MADTGAYCSSHLAQGVASLGCPMLHTAQARVDDRITYGAYIHSITMAFTDAISNAIHA